MKFLISGLIFLFSAAASAQYNVIESNFAPNRFKVFGAEWNPSFFSLASLENDKMPNGGRLGTYNYLTFDTFAGDNLHFKLRLPFTYGTAGTDRFDGERMMDQQLQLQDIILALTSVNMWLLPFDIGQYWEGRLYLPVSQSSKQSGQIAALRNEFIFTKQFSRSVGVEYDQQFYYYMQSKSVYMSHFQDENGFDVDAPSVTKRAKLDHWINPFVRISDSFSAGFQVGWEDTWWNRSNAENKSKPAEHLLKMGPSIRFPIGKSANFLLSYEDKVNANNRQEFGRFLSKNAEIVLLSWIAL
jgi:hypothetical protein